ncbi:hypothetical protein AC579_8736 [Pseudocercospora musae]|uniref:DUF7729 domain-containing protein n=1 Tax=Pseudocercospora musae TaxID=113226 RepID=A0A139IW82_9PEZI|nr:hypothetical protein AC579_8736 [Pseudocercospora musae]
MSSSSKPVALVIGASRGLGRQVAIDLAKNGYRVIVSAKTTSNASQCNPFPPDPNSFDSTINTVAREISEIHGGEAEAIACDVRFYDQIQELVKRGIEEKFGRLDVVVYNSGAIWWSSVEGTDFKRFQINPEGLYGTVQAALPYLYKSTDGGKGRGRIVVVSPPIYSRFVKGKAAYAMGKFGMSALTMGLAVDWGREGRTGLAITSLWPAVAIDSAATQSARSYPPQEGRKQLRKPEIFSDAILGIINAPAKDVNGKTLLDEDFLREHEGVTDFSKYALVPGTTPRRIMPTKMPDLSVAEQDDEGVRVDSAAQRKNKFVPALAVESRNHAVLFRLPHGGNDGVHVRDEALGRRFWTLSTVLLSKLNKFCDWKLLSAPLRVFHLTDRLRHCTGYARATQYIREGAMTTDTSCAFSSCSSTRTPLAAVQPWRCCRRQEPGWNEPNKNVCNHLRSPPEGRGRKKSKHSARDRSIIPRLGFVQSFTLSVIFCLLLCRGTNAGQVYAAATEVFPRELLFDRSPPPPLPRMRLDKRQDEDSSSVLPSTTIRPSDVSGSATATESSVQTATDTATALPQPFDTNLGNNFTSTTCPTFFTDFLNNQTFKDCLPFSLLLQTSNAFFTASRSVVRLTQALDASCKVDFQKCSAVMAGLAIDIQSNDHCGPDLQMMNPMVSQAFNGFKAYDTLYHAGCLTDSSGNYCYANAATNISAPASSYIYYLPLGVQLPGGSRPACTQCLQNTMSIFAETAGNSSQPLSRHYVSAAEQVQMNCGPTFVKSSVEMSSSASHHPAVTGLLSLTTFAILLLGFFV